MIPDNKMSASSEDQSHPAKNGRLEDRVWSPDEHNNHDKFSYLYLVCGFKIWGCFDVRPRPAWLTIYRVQVSPEKDFRNDWNSIKVWFLPMSYLLKFPFFFHLNMPNCGDRVWKRQVELLTSQLWYFNVSQCFDQQQSERTKKKSEKKLGNMSEYFQCLSWLRYAWR